MTLSSFYFHVSLHLSFPGFVLIPMYSPVLCFTDSSLCLVQSLFISSEIFLYYVPFSTVFCILCQETSREGKEVLPAILLLLAFFFGGNSGFFCLFVFVLNTLKLWL